MRPLRILSAAAALLLLASCGGPPAVPADITQAPGATENTTTEATTAITATELSTETMIATTTITTTSQAPKPPLTAPPAYTPRKAAVYPTDPSAILLTFGGDCTFGNVNDEARDNRFPETYARSGSYTYPFDGVRHIFERDDMTVINFEGTLTTAAAQDEKTWRFKGLPAYAGILPAASVEAASLANNHAPRDYLEQGYSDTMKHLRAAGVGLVTQDSPLVTVIKGVEIVLVGGNSAYVIRERAAQGVLNQIARHKRGDNVVIVFMHWGTEKEYVPDEWQVQTARDYIDAGADLVVGHHPHVLQGIERYKGKYIVYSLGNLSYGGNALARDPETMLLHVTIPAGVQPPEVDIAVTPCYITSGTATNKDGELRNDYRPRVLAGGQADAVISLLLARSAVLPNGVDDVAFYESF